jgi:hypothetical protein
MISATTAIIAAKNWIGELKPMKSDWFVSSNRFDEEMYIAARLIDKNAANQAVNREYSGDYLKDRDTIQRRVDELNSIGMWLNHD